MSGIRSLQAFLVAILAFAHAATGAAIAQAEGQILNYERADLRAVINDVATFTGRTFVVDPSVAGKVTVFSREPLTPDGVWEVFVATLSVAGYSAVPTREGFYKILPLNSAAREPGLGLDENGVAAESFVTRVFRLSRADARETAANVKPLLSPEGVISALVSENAIVVADAAGRVQRVAEIIDTLDFSRVKSETVPLSNLSAGEAARIIREALGARNDGPRRGLNVTAAPAVNAVIIRGTDEERAEARGLLRELDRQSIGRSGVDIIFLVHADAEEMAAVLERLSGAGLSGYSSGGGGERAGAAQQATVAAFAPANALIITADAELRAIMKTVAERLDIRRPQVRVEAIIVEINDNLTRDLGIDLFLAGDNVPFTATNYSRTAPNVLAAAGAFLLDGFSGSTTTETTAPDGTVTSTTEGPPAFAQTLADTALTSLLGASGGIIGGTGRLDNGAAFGAILTAIEEDTESNILSTPSILTLDNQPSSFLVGQEIPITTGESLNTGGAGNINPFRTVQRQEIGTKLEVTPQINDGNTVTLEIRQEVSSIFGTVSSSSDEIIIDKREIETTVVAGDGEIIVLGGLIDQRETRSESEVPFLGDIPILGWFFQAKSRQSTKRNLMVLLRPVIIRTDEDARAVTAQVYNYVNSDAVIRDGRGDTTLDSYLNSLIGAGAADQVKGYAPGVDGAGAETPEGERP